jgi:two-component system, cell cycle sensor histidine kinase and response regulator CckA
MHPYGQLDPKTILVVDDDISVLTVVKCMLESSDYNVLLANDADIALRMAERDDLSIDLLLTDVVMPAVNGPDLAKRIQAIRPALKVLFMSGYTDSDVVRVRVLEEHALGFLPKPFTSDSLLETVNRVLIAPVQRSFSAVAGSRPR